MPRTLSTATKATTGANSSNSPIARYQIDDRFTVALRPNAAHRIDVWCPIISDTPHQRVLGIAVDAPGPWTTRRDPEHGNLILHTRLAAPLPTSVAVRVRYTVERRAVGHTLDPAWARPIEAPAPFLASLRAERHVVVDDRTRAIASEVIGDETNVLSQARRIYDHVTRTMSYNAEQQSWKGSTEHALACSTGNCNDIHALFISLCRSIGIPARLVLGQAFEPRSPGQEQCELCGYHCWAEFFVSGLGWVPADASCACKYDKEDLFGDLELNHIAWSVGRDLLLEPPQRGGRLLFFAGPYVEADGQPWPGGERRIGFAELPPGIIGNDAEFLGGSKRHG